MQYKLTEKESDAIRCASSAERLRQFTLMIIESEEVWGIGEASGWLLQSDESGHTCLPVWPNKEFASAMAVGDWSDQYAMAVSLDHFVYSVLNVLKDEDYSIEIFPTSEDKGEVVSAHMLYEMLEGLIDAGEYYMEG